MLSSVTLPLWLLVLIVVFAAVTFASHFLFPSVRWFFRRRMERAVARLNTRLERPIEPFKLMRRQDNVNRLVYDPEVMQAVAAYSEEEGVPRTVAFEKARRYAREIVPGFSAATYFGFATRVARKLSGFFFDVRLGHSAEDSLRGIDPKAAIVFVFNHRSNMDYVLTTQLSEGRSALSYAAGEWARVWPLNILVRLMGAYYIRRRDSNPLYRAVLARYVQMMVNERVTQAIFPEGGLSLNGAVGPAKKGLIHYIVRDFDPMAEADVVFVPVAINYDRVLEDALLVRAGQRGERRFGVSKLKVAGALLRIIWLKLWRRFPGFGFAAVAYGAPVSLQRFLTSYPGANTETLVDSLMDGVRSSMPMLPVPLAAACLVTHDGDASFGALAETAGEMVTRLQASGARLHLPGDSLDDALKAGLSTLVRREMVEQDTSAQHYRLTPEARDLVGFYAASFLQRLAACDSGDSDAIAQLAPQERSLPKA